MAERHEELAKALRSIDDGKERVRKLLAERLKVGGTAVDWSINVAVEADPEVSPVEDGTWVDDAPNKREILDAFVRGDWWYSSLIVEVMMGHTLMGIAVVSAVIAGQVPGSPFHNEWEDEDENWLQLAEEAVDEAAQLVEKVKRVDWVQFVEPEKPADVNAAPAMAEPAWPQERAQ